MVSVLTMVWVKTSKDIEMSKFKVGDRVLFINDNGVVFGSVSDKPLFISSVREEEGTTFYGFEPSSAPWYDRHTDKHFMLYSMYLKNGISEERGKVGYDNAYLMRPLEL